MGTYLVHLPLEAVASDIKVGGPLCIKTGSVQAYVGFATASLAQEFCVYWNINGAEISCASELKARGELNPSITAVVRFPDGETLAKYKAAPELFPCEQYFVSV